MSVKNTIVLSTDYGDMLVNRHDINQTQHFLQRGSAIDSREIESVLPLIVRGSIAVDVGACFGAWTLAMARLAGAVFSFEAQRYLCNCLSGSLALNSIENVFVQNAALGAENGSIQVPKYDLSQSLQFGGIFLCPKTGHGAQPQTIVGHETTSLLTLDSFQLTSVSFVKIDVEGMEFDVLKGAEKTIAANRPAIHLEHFLSDTSGITDFLENRNYIYIKDEMNLTALPKEKFSMEKLESGAIKITSIANKE